MSDLCAAMIGGLGVAGGAKSQAVPDPTAVGTIEFADAVIEEMNA